MIQKRIFLSINLPNKIRQDIFSVISDWPKEKYKIVKKENLHFTVFYFGYFPENKISLVNESFKEILEKIKPFYVEMEKINSFPLNSPIKKIIYIEIKENENINLIRRELNEKRKIFKKENFILEKKENFIPHITLAQIKNFKKQTKLNKLINLKEFYKIKIKINNIHLMESEIINREPKYKIINTFTI